MKKRETINEVLSLMRRMEDTSNGDTGLLSEVTCKWRDVNGANDFYDVISSIKEGNFMTFGYVDDAKIEVPTRKIGNREFSDYERLGEKLGKAYQVVNVLKVAIYNIPWQTLPKINKQYSEFAKKRNELGAKYDVTFDPPKYKTKTIPFGSGISKYDGDNPEIQNHTYTNLNMHNIKPISVGYYLVTASGYIEKVDEKLLKILPPSGVSAIKRLAEAGATEAELAPLLNMDYKRFEHSKVLFVSATPENGIPTLVINNKLSDELVGADRIKKKDLLKIAKDRYKKFFKNANKNAVINFMHGV